MNPLGENVDAEIALFLYLLCKRSDRGKSGKGGHPIFPLSREKVRH
jgi:hypothetical protein